MKKQLSYVITILIYFLANILSKAVTASKPNIIIYMTDDQGFGVMPGNLKIALPNLRKFISQGKILNRAYTTSLCAPSRWAAYTGSNGVLDNGFDGVVPVPDITLPKAMANIGYNTAIIGKYGFGDNKTISSAYNMGFKYSYIYPSHNDAHITFPLSLEDNGNVIYFPQNRYATTSKCLGSNNRCIYAPDLFYSKAVQYIKYQANIKQPFFLVWAPNMPHAGKFIVNMKKMTCPAPTYGVYARQQRWTAGQKGYASMMTNYIDRDIGSLVNLLANLSLSNNTYVLYYSDNGNEPTLLGTNQFFRANGILRDGKGSQYEGGIRVPAVIWGPGKIPMNTSSNYFFHMQNLLPTITELAGNKVIKNTANNSAAKIWLHEDPKNSSDNVNDIFIALCPNNKYSDKCTYSFISLKEWPNNVMKLLDNGNGAELYNIIKDPGETQNLANIPNFNKTFTELKKQKLALTMA